MSVFGKLFGGKKQPTGPTTQEALQKLQETEDLLMKKQEFLEKKIATEIASARSHGTKNKRLALQALKRKKNHEKQLEHLDGVLNTIQHQKASLENASMNSDVLQVVSGAAKALKGAHNEMDVDQVHDLMEDIAEQHEVANEIAAAISNPTGLQNDVDEDELLKELEEMEEEDLEKELLKVGVAPADSIIADKLPAKQEDDDLAELEAWANA
ncbi:snf7 domain-containing protein [Ditylenchus destructor]|uniref:Snf7 domain-containing protein n=1 Tax=Ditylenchus destructor TaxID=166010 RepID=A0AAD4NCG4_9BILA|nr:snf7 domain-containing protein [Ditylenchus destructor]